MKIISTWARCPQREDDGGDLPRVIATVRCATTATSRVTGDNGKRPCARFAGRRRPARRLRGRTDRLRALPAIAATRIDCIVVAPFEDPAGQGGRQKTNRATRCNWPGCTVRAN